MKITPNVPTGAFTLNPWATWDVLLDDNGKPVALFSSKEKQSQLAMAAPEMLEALRMFLAYNDQGAPLHFDTDTMWAKARSVVAKIEGGGSE